MMILDNECKMGTYIVFDGTQYIIKDKIDGAQKIQGIGGITDDNKLVGMYLKEEQVYFLYDKEEFEMVPDKFSCENRYISTTEREFTVRINDKLICQIKYVPFIDPGMLWYDADIEEYDFLLRFYNMVKDEKGIQSIVKWIKEK